MGGGVHLVQNVDDLPILVEQETLSQDSHVLTAHELLQSPAVVGRSRPVFRVRQ